MRDTFKVEKYGKPRKPTNTGKRSPSSMSYPFLKCKLQDSFLVSGMQMLGASGMVCRFNRRNPSMKFVTRRSENGIRVYRVR
jgi:hypothetical protein